jgi:hypothetical protein
MNVNVTIFIGNPTTNQDLTGDAILKLAPREAQAVTQPCPLGLCSQPCSCPHGGARFPLLKEGSVDVIYWALPSAAIVGVACARVFAAGTLETFTSLIGQGFALIEGAYQRAPALVLILSALLILPVVALLSLATRARIRSRSRQAALRAAQRRAQAGSLIKETPAQAGLAAWPLQAWLTIQGQPSGTLPLAGQVIRIGRHEDNDIRLADRSVHRYHAVIERTPDEAFVITDVSGKDGNGVRINGERTARSRLADGDVIELGRARLRFEHAPV